MTSPAVAAILRTLPREQADRLVDLAVFPADEDVPGVLVELLWAATGGLTGDETRRLAEAFARRVLVDEFGIETGDIRLDPAVRGHLIEAAGPDGLARTYGALLDAAAGVADRWWALPESHAFLIGHLAGMLAGAGRRSELDLLVTDPRWLEARLRRHGVSAVLADLAQSSTPDAAALARAIERARELLGPIVPAHALGAVLADRLRDVPRLRESMDAYAATLPTPRLASRWALPDHPHPALLRAVPTGSGVRSVAVAPDGGWVAAAGADGAVRWWDRAGGFLAGYPGGATGVAIAPDGTWLANADADGTVRLRDVTGDALAGGILAGHAGAVTAVAIAADGTWLASTGADGTVRLWDASARAERSVLAGHAGGATGVAIAPDGTWLAAAGADGTVRLWDVAAGTQRALPAGHGTGAACVAIAPDGTWLATGGADGAIRLRDAATGTERNVLTGHRSAVRAVAIAPEGDRLASAGADNSVRLWDAATGAVVAAGLRHSGSATAVAFAPDGTWLVSAGEFDGRLIFWRTADAAAPYEPPGNTDAVAVSRVGGWLATVEGTVPIRDIATGAERLRLARGTNQIAAAPDGSWLAAADYDVVRIYSTDDGSERATLPKHIGWVWTVAVAPDGSWLATGDNGSRKFRQVGDGAVRIWDAATGKLRHRIKAHRDAVTRVAIAPDGRWLASAGHDGMVRVWDPETGERQAEWRARLHVVRDMAIAPDGTWLALAGGDPDVQILDTATGERRAVWRGRSPSAIAIAIAPDGDRVAVAGGNLLEIRESAHGRVLTAMRVGGDLRACAWLPDGRAVCAVGRSGTYLFDVVDG